MIIKKFQGKTENEAVEAAKKELGNNVVIMNVKNAKKKGFFAFLRPTMVEVTAAVEDENERKDPPPVPATTARSITEALGKIAPIVEKAEAERTAEARVKAEPVKRETVAETSPAIEEKLDNIQTLIKENLKKPEEDIKEEKTSDDKDKSKKEENKESDELNVFYDLLIKTMEENEVDTGIAESIVEETRKTVKPGTPFDAALAGIYQKMILKFGKPSVIAPATKGPKTVFFVGPTGVGKTTTIAKIASKFSVEDKKKVALLTADTYRIAAAEQLRTYANILEVPFRIIYTIEEMESALNDLHDFDYVFVDTAGHSHQNAEQKSVMGSFIHSVDGNVEKEVYLVVSSTTKYRDLKSIADAYSEITDYKLIFTKLDETTALGNLLNLKLYTGASLSYVTCGQNVPDDIEEFNAQSTVKNLLGGKR